MLDRYLDRRKKERVVCKERAEKCNICREVDGKEEAEREIIEEEESEEKESEEEESEKEKESEEEERGSSNEEDTDTAEAEREKARRVFE